MRKTAFLALLLAASSLTACSEKAASDPQSTNEAFSGQNASDAPGNETAAPEEEPDSLEARALVDDGLGEHDFGGDTFRMLYQ